MRNEIIVRRASNWEFYALQTEEERGEGGFALPLEIDHASNITVANLHMYRVVSSYQPFPYAIEVSDSKNVRLRNIHCYSDSRVSFDNSVYDQTHNYELRQREFAWLTISGNPPQVAPKKLPPTVAAAAKLEKLATGFYNISGAAVAPSGDVYFVDPHWQKIYRWSVDARRLSTVADSPLDPANLVFDKAGNLMATSYSGAGTVYAFDPRKPGFEVKLLKPEPAAARPGMTAALPVDFWRFENDFVEGVPVKKPYQFVSPDGTTFIPAGDDFIRGTLYYGSKMHDVLRAFALAKAEPGKPFYVSDEGDLTTYTATVDDNGTLTNTRWFANQGGEGSAVDSHGNLYMAAGQIFVYAPTGQQVGEIDVPERPTALVFGGKDHKSLFIAARSSLYAIRIE